MQPHWTRSGKRSIAEREGCSGGRCTQAPVTFCGFVDQWGWRCDGPCCAGHRYRFSELDLCVSHAALCLSFGGDSPPLEGELHDPYQQTPSLLHWLTRGLDAEIRSMLDPHHEKKELIHRQYVRAGYLLEWEAEWRRPDTELVVSVVIGGHVDPRIVVRHGDEVLLSESPEWLVHHRLGLPTDLELDASLRREAVRRIGAAVALSDIATTLVDLTGHVDMSRDWETAN